MAQEQAISIPLLGVNQKAPQSSGPVGRLQQIKNGVVIKMQNGQIKVQKRDGFAKLSNEVRTPFDGSQISASAGVPAPLLLSSAKAGQRLVSTDGSSKFYRYNDERPCEELANELDLTTGNPTQTPATYVPISLQTNTLLSNNTFVSMPSVSAVGNLRCYVWGQGDLTNLIPAVTVWAEVVDVFGVQIRAPFILGTSTAAIGGRIKTVSDGSNFWVFWDIGTTGLMASVISGTLGTTLAGSTSFYTMNTAGNHWDVVYDSSVGVCAATGLSATFGFHFDRLTYASGSISVAVSADNFSIGPSEGIGTSVDAGLGFLVSKEADGHVYLATVVSGDGKAINVGQLNPNGTTAHTYVYVDGVSVVGLANLTGFVNPGTQDVYICWTQLPQTAVPLGNSLGLSTLLLFSGSATGLATQRAMTWASKPIFMGGRYLIAGWYPSQLSQIVDPNALSNKLGTQPSYFMYDIAGAQLVGNFEQDTAVMDFSLYGWVAGTTTAPGAAFFMLPLAAVDANGIHLPLIALYQRFSPTFDAVAFSFTGNVGTALASVLIRDVVLGSAAVRTVEYASETLLPGLAAFDEGDLSEQGFWLAPEPPSLAQSNSGGSALTLGQTYQIICVWECLDSRGDLVQSQLSVAEAITLAGSNNQITLTQPTLRHTRHPKVLAGVYSTYVNALGVMSTDHRAVFPLPNATANNQFADTITIVINATDAVISQGRPLYADPTASPVPLEYFSPPAFTVGEVFADRAFVAADDGSVRFSMEKVQGQAVAFHPDLAITLPSAERIRSIAAMDGFLLLGCDASIWYIENSGFPDATGTGSIPTPVKLPFPNGMKSPARGTKDGVFYASSAGGFWMVGRDLTNTYIGAAIEDDSLTSTIVDIVVDQSQRVHFVDQTGQQDLVWDTVVGQWYTWALPAVPLLATVYLGQVVFAAATFLWQQIPGTFVDDTVAIVTTTPLAPMAFAGVPGLEMVWELQFLGQRAGRHTINVTLFYDDDTQSTESFSEDSDSLGIGFNNGEAYRFGVPPSQPECQAIAATIFDSFPLGASAGYTLENVGASVGIVPGVRRINISQRIAG